MSIATRIKTLEEQIEKSRRESLLSQRPVTLLAASKGQDTARIEEAIRAGLTEFGENRVQEAFAKWPALRAAYPHVRLHLIGPLQSNKARQAIALFDVIQTIDRPALADSLANELRRTPKPLSCYIQINTGEEPQKAGISPKNAEALITHCRHLGLPLTGLMCIPPAHQPPAPHFALLYQLAQRHGLPELSMGMSDDFEIAVRLGSTCVRVGRALFGERPR